ncbi:hypothetical protein Xthr_00380 [Xanthomonas citri pv. thirumalacharii]|nr:hypothetical protein [Xanthomonas citri pv. thirumalacharii]
MFTRMPAEPLFEVLPANYVRARKVYRRGRPAALKELAKLQRQGKRAKRTPESDGGNNLRASPCARDDG